MVREEQKKKKTRKHGMENPFGHTENEQYSYNNEVKSIKM